MSSDLLQSRLKAFFADVLDPAVADALAARLSHSEAGPACLILLSELQEKSPKVARAAMENLPDAAGILTDTEIVTWLDVAVAMIERSGAAALRYCRESLDAIRTLPVGARAEVLKVIMEAAEQDGALALETLRQADAVIAAAGISALSSWVQVGLDLARWDYVLGSEYLRCSAGALKVLGLDDMKLWVGLSTKLVTANSLGKADYIAALTYLRTSPLILGDIGSVGARRKILCLAGALAERAPDTAIQFLGEAPVWFRSIGDPEWREKALNYGMLLADKDAASALAYLRQAPDMIRMICPDPGTTNPSAARRFEDWYKQGMEVLAYSSEAARAYFAAETRQALEAIERASGSLSLREVARMLKLFAQGLSGKPVTIRAQSTASADQQRLPFAAEYGVISLPPRVGVYPEREENLRLYKLMTAHEAGRLEYGTYDIEMDRLHDIAAQACLRYGREPVPALGRLQELFECYPEPLLMRDLWILAEDARIEASLKQEYPGLRAEMEAMVVQETPRRSLLAGMAVKEMVVELLLRLSAQDSEEVHIPFALDDVVGRAWALLQTVAKPGASAESVVRVVHRAYVLIDELTAESEGSASSDSTGTEGPKLPPAAGKSQGETFSPARPTHPSEGDPAKTASFPAYHPLVNLAYRGVIDIERIGLRDSTVSANLEGASLTDPGGASSPAPASESSRSASSLDGGARGVLMIDQQARSGSVDMIGETSGPPAGRPKEIGAFFYDEWDSGIQDYRNQWCRVVEEIGVEGGDDFVERTRSAYGGMIQVLRRYFESIRPPALRRLRRQADGEEVDIEAAIEGLVEWRAQAAPNEFIYVRRDRRERDVATAFLMDLSGSTGRLIGATGSRIIDVEKQGLVVLAEALEAIGDQYAVYGYSGRTRRDVRFVVLKSFEERYGAMVWRRFDAVAPLVQNRDGAAIRHAVYRLLARSARVKLLILLSDGRPLDDQYADDYAIADTRAALREAKARGVHVFCITVDQEASSYLSRMYGDVCYLIIDRVESLPERLPRIYKMLTT